MLSLLLLAGHDALYHYCGSLAIYLGLLRQTSGESLLSCYIMAPADTRLCQGGCLSRARIWMLWVFLLPVGNQNSIMISRFGFYILKPTLLGRLVTRWLAVKHGGVLGAYCGRCYAEILFRFFYGERRSFLFKSQAPQVCHRSKCSQISRLDLNQYKTVLRMS